MPTHAASTVPLIARVTGGVLLVGLVLGTGAVWFLPVQAAQQWSIQRAGDDPYAQFEAAGQAEAVIWLSRFLLPVLAVVTAAALQRPHRIGNAARRVARGFLQATDLGSPGWRNWLVRAGCLMWIGLAGVHLLAAIEQRTIDWAYFRLQSGEEVLPNISDSNRLVIRYLREATPPDARILVLSDQKLFFLSYYLLPRRLYHPMHPDAEFVIPQPHQQRTLPAYRLSDLDEEYLDEINPDYVLEYFEAPGNVDPDRLLEDGAWLNFARTVRRDPQYVPPFNVILRPGHAEDDAS